MAWVEGKGQDWTPTVTQSGAVAVTVTYARYFIVGEVAIVQALLAVTGAGTATNAIIIGGQPAAIQPANTATFAAIGVGIVRDSGGSVSYTGILTARDVTDWRFQAHNVGPTIGISPDFALASGDEISFQAAYEI